MAELELDQTSFSGVDIKATVHIPDRSNQTSLLALYQQLATARDPIVKAALTKQITVLNSNQAGQVKTLAEIQSISISTYREKYPVRACGSVFAKNYTRGQRTVAGSIVFTVFDRNVLYEILQADNSEFDQLPSTALVDQLPPFNISISFANENGQMSQMTIYGVDIISEGQVMSVHDLFIENTVQYVARDIDPMYSVGNARTTVPYRTSIQTASDLANTPENQAYANSLNPFINSITRSNPFE